jgi:hypothetical protein
MVKVEDYIFVGKNQDTKRYHLFCDKCNSDRGYGMKSRSHMLCKKCTHEGKSYTDHSTPEFKANMSKAKKGQVPYNKGLSLSKEHKQKISTTKMKTSKNYKAKEHRKLRQYVSNSIGKKMFNRGYRKAFGIFRHLPYTVQELRSHLESKFTDDMSWDNYGKWHIDHIKPDSWFTYSSVEDQDFKDSWALSNLQPLWAKDNLSKGNRYIG